MIKIELEEHEEQEFRPQISTTLNSFNFETQEWWSSEEHAILMQLNWLNHCLIE